MALSSATLSTQLQGIPNGTNPVSARTAFADAFHTYMLASIAGGLFPINVATATTARAAMLAALGSLNNPNAGAATLTAGVTAYWAALNVPLSYGVCTSVTPPPGIAGLTSALQTVFTANKNANLAKAPACNAIAGAWHPLMLGGNALILLVPTPIT